MLKTVINKIDKRRTYQLNQFLKLILKIVFLLTIFIATYYFLYLRPKIESQKNLAQAKRVLTLHKNTLIQNRIAFVELTRLNPQSANFDNEKSNLVETLKKTGEDGLKSTEDEKILSKVNDKLNNRFPSLLDETKVIYQDQTKLLEKVFVTKSYSEGLVILKSPEAITLLTNQTNLILEYEFLINNLKI